MDFPPDSILLVVGDPVPDPEQGELLESGPLTEDDIDDEAFVPEPAKLMRIGGMIRKLLEEVRHAELDEAGRDRMRDVYHLSVDELATALSEPLADELNRIAQPFDEDST